MMNHGHFLYVAAWMREAQEATKLVENIDSRIKNKDLAEELMLRDIAQSKLREAGVKLDCLGSFLHNPPSKPNLTFTEVKKIRIFDEKANGFTAKNKSTGSQSLRIHINKEVQLVSCPHSS
ncbi:hypothetical protein BDE02_05G039600 [Populus trichocarpa]|nr:hypothetical protein BDE02_05G039600 [Populus trichocarpa]